MRFRIPAAFGLASLALAASAVAPGLAAAADAPTPLPTVKRTLSSGSAVARSCDAATLPGARRGTDAATYRAPIAGYLTIRTAASDRSDWDIAVYDARTRNQLGTSEAFGSHELFQTWVGAGQRIAVTGCRRSGSARSLAVRFLLLAVNPPKATGKAMLVKVAIKSRKHFEALEATGLDVTHDVGPRHANVLLGGAADLATLTRAGFAYRVLNPDANASERRARLLDARRAAAPGRSPLPSGREEYRELGDYQSELKALAEKNPAIVRPATLGKTYQGRDQMGVEIAANVASNDGRPTFLLVGMHHAREWAAAETPLEYALMLVNEYGKDPRITKLLDTSRVFVFPIMNVDGFQSTRNFASLALTANGIDNGGVEGVAFGATGTLTYRRKNCAGLIPSPQVPCELQVGIDPNRNYSQFWGGPGSSPDPTDQTYRGPSPASEPEVQAVIEFTRRHQVTSLITVHNVAALVLRPPGVESQGLAPDEARMKKFGDAMGKATGYASQYGWQLYDTSGTTEDYTYAAQGGYGYTIEIGPSNGDFHSTYQVSVVDEWTGTDVQKGKGLREAYLIAHEAAASTPDHSVIAGRAPAGRTLRLHRDFITKTKETCSMNLATAMGFAGEVLPCQGETLPAMDLKDFVDATMTVPASGKFEWHINPSTQPFVAKAGGTQAYTLTCEEGGKVIETKTVTVKRGQKLTMDVPCGTKLPLTASAKRKRCLAKARKIKSRSRRNAAVKRCQAAYRRETRKK